MTLSSAQRGDPVEGWNDCPPMMMNTNGSSTSVNKMKKRAQRVGHNINNNSNTSLLGIGGSLNMAASPSRSELPPTPCKVSQGGLSGPSPLASNTQIKDDVDDDDVSTTTTDVGQLLESLFLAKSLLLDREHDHYAKKLKDVHSTLELNHMTFLVSVLQKVDSAAKAKANAQIPSIKSDVVQYMIMNDGVSGWCIPLRKVVESLNVA